MIYDCFSFFNELDVLEIRLNTLSEVVDRFVLVEAVWTHSGKPKPLYFNEAKTQPRFAKFADRIVHIIVDDEVDWHGDTWVLENFQRNAITRGLADCNPDDVILVSDVDEIPFPESVFSYKSKCMDSHQMINLIPYYFCYYVNMLAIGYRLKAGTVMASWGYLQQLFAEDTGGLPKQEQASTFSLQRYYCGPKKLIVNWSGWHFTYLGGAEKVMQKLQAFGHQELNVNLSVDSLQKKINQRQMMGHDFRLESGCVDSTCPPYILANQSRFGSLIFPSQGRKLATVMSRHRRYFAAKRLVKRCLLVGMQVLCLFTPPIAGLRGKFRRRIEIRRTAWELRSFD